MVDSFLYRLILGLILSFSLVFGIIFFTYINVKKTLIFDKRKERKKIDLNKTWDKAQERTLYFAGYVIILGLTTIAIANIQYWRFPDNDHLKYLSYFFMFLTFIFLFFTLSSSIGRDVLVFFYIVKLVFFTIPCNFVKKIFKPQSHKNKKDRKDNKNDQNTSQ